MRRRDERAFDWMLDLVCPVLGAALGLGLVLVIIELAERIVR